MAPRPGTSHPLSLTLRCTCPAQQPLRTGWAQPLPGWLAPLTCISWIALMWDFLFRAVRAHFLLCHRKVLAATPALSCAGSAGEGLQQWLPRASPSQTGLLPSSLPQ